MPCRSGVLARRAKFAHTPGGLGLVLALRADPAANRIHPIGKDAFGAIQAITISPRGLELILI
jgi:hypothetical protein